MAKKIGCAVIRAVQGVFVAALALVLLANLYTLAAQRLFHNDSPAILGYRTAVVLTGSMEPAIRADDLVIVHRQETYSAGDIIMFRSGANTTTHRVTEVTAVPAPLSRAESVRTLALSTFSTAAISSTMPERSFAVMTTVV